MKKEFKEMNQLVTYFNSNVNEMQNLVEEMIENNIQMIKYQNEMANIIESLKDVR